jgi:hypothetical protein
MDNDLESKSAIELNALLHTHIGVGIAPLAGILSDVIAKPIFQRQRKKGKGNGWNLPPIDFKKNRFLTEEEIARLATCPDDRDQGESSISGMTTMEYKGFDKDVARYFQKRITNLRKRIYGTLYDLDLLHGDDAKRKPSLESLQKWGLCSFMGRLQMDYYALDRTLAIPGFPANGRTEAICLWALHVRLQKRPLSWSWPILVETMDWFGARLAPCAYYKTFFSDEDINDVEDLKKQFYGKKKRWQVLYDYRMRKQEDPRFPWTCAGIVDEGVITIFGDGPNQIANIHKLMPARLVSLERGAYGTSALCLIRKYPMLRSGVIFPDFSYFIE